MGKSDTAVAGGNSKTANDSVVSEMRRAQSGRPLSAAKCRASKMPDTLMNPTAIHRLVRARGIEPLIQAWEAHVLPLYYAR